MKLKKPTKLLFLSLGTKNVQSDVAPALYLLNLAFIESTTLQSITT